MANSYTIVGLGNPGEEYALTRHNAGRIMLENFIKKSSIFQVSGFKFKEWQYDKKLNSLKLEIKHKNNKFLLLMPETFMNNSGKAISKIITSKKKAENLIVIHDDIDLPIGKFKISFNRGPAGHKGIESIIRAIKTRGFIRIRIGITPTTPSGKLKKPKGEKFLDFITGKFKPKEFETISKTAKEVAEALDAILGEGLQKAMNEWN